METALRFDSDTLAVWTRRTKRRVPGQPGLIATVSAEMGGPMFIQSNGFPAQ